MIDVSLDNLQSGIDAESAFFGFLCRLVKDGSLAHSRTAFFSLNFAFASYINVNVTNECRTDIDPCLLELGAFLACTCKIYELASIDQIDTDQWIAISSAITCSRFFHEHSVHHMIGLLRQGELGLAEKWLDQLYLSLVKTWWLNLPGSSCLNYDK